MQASEPNHPDENPDDGAGQGQREREQAAEPGFDRSFNRIEALVLMLEPLSNPSVIDSISLTACFTITGVLFRKLEGQ
ncbi:MAG: hypothetical protein OXF68_09390 [Gammaproteobacteria bacterium]|nr:hypothetical protein [Gammaproteobacteria bacterium]